MNRQSCWKLWLVTKILWETVICNNFITILTTQKIFRYLEKILFLTKIGTENKSRRRQTKGSLQVLRTRVWGNRKISLEEIRILQTNRFSKIIWKEILWLRDWKTSPLSICLKKSWSSESTSIDLSSRCARTKYSFKPNKNSSPLLIKVPHQWLRRRTPAKTSTRRTSTTRSETSTSTANRKCRLTAFMNGSKEMSKSWQTSTNFNNSKW